MERLTLSSLEKLTLPSLGVIITWCREKEEARERKIVLRRLMDINTLTVTIHGRLALTKVCLGGGTTPPEIKRMYWALLNTAPVREYAEMN